MLYHSSIWNQLQASTVLVTIWSINNTGIPDLYATLVVDMQTKSTGRDTPATLVVDMRTKSLGRESQEVTIVIEEW